MQYANELSVFIGIFIFENTTISKWHKQFLDLCSRFRATRTVYTYKIHSDREIYIVCLAACVSLELGHRLDSPVQKKAFQAESYIEYAKNKSKITTIIIVAAARR
jgi:hypothetical protein